MDASGMPADELAIRSLVARYVDAVYRRDEDDWAATWAEKASWSVMGKVVTGRNQIVALWLQAMDLFSFVAMQIHSGTVKTPQRGAGISPNTSSIGTVTER